MVAVGRLIAPGCHAAGGGGVPDGEDECPTELNPSSDEDGDGCDDNPDRDGDGVPNTTDNCPDEANPNQQDVDDDGIGDVCDDDDGGDGPKWLEWSGAIWYGVMAGALIAAILFGLTR